MQTLYLSGNNLSGAIPPELGDLGNLRTLYLSGNDLSGAIPPELGDLGNLRTLYLSDNELSDAIPPDLGGLSNLRSLSLARNELSSAIPPALGNLGNLRTLYLSGNDLSGAIPPDLGDLSDLIVLDLNDNGLSSAIPPEFGGLGNLRTLHLFGNKLTDAIPPGFGNLSHLGELDLSDNGLSGAIPPELGNLGQLVKLRLTDNSLSGPVPPGLGGLALLRELELARNPGLAGALPLALTALGVLESLQAGGTELCALRDSGFKAWLATIPKQRIPPCGNPPAAYLVQAVQSSTHPVPLVAGKDALLRVFVTSARPTTEVIPQVRARFYLNGAERHVAGIAASSTPIPTESDEGDLSKSANAEIPGQIVRPGLELVVEIDPSETLDPDLGVPKRIPEEGRLAIDVREIPTLNLTVVPFLWAQNPDSLVLEAVEEWVEDPRGHPALEPTRNLLPVGHIALTAHKPVITDDMGSHIVLPRVEAIRTLEGGRGHYMGLASGRRTPLPLARLGGWVSVSDLRPLTIAHELGHNMNLSHAPCGRAPNPDRSFPNADGSIGNWGYDFGKRRLVGPHRPDLMAYCDKRWISDYHFTQALRHRVRNEGTPAAALAAAPVSSLLLWGGVDTTGVPFLNPAFVTDAPPALPDSAGDYALTGQDTSGRELFSLSFAMAVAVSEEEEGSSFFVFALPVRASWAEALASVTLSGPDGTATLDGDSDLPMAILRDPVTGQIRGILRDPALEAGVAADASGAVAPGLEVLFSRGIPGAAAWRR